MKYLPPAITAEIESFFNGYPLRRYKKGQILVLPGEAAEHAYFLAEGRIKLYDTSYRGDQIIIDVFNQPAFFPLALIMNGSLSFLFHEADTDIVVRQAPVEETLEFLNTHPEVVLNLLSVLYRKFDDATRRMVRLMDGGAKVRLIHEIIITCRQQGEQHEDGSYMIAISQAILGARLGLARETVSRELKSLKEKGLIITGRSSIRVPDISALEAYLTNHT
jgi:CRP-like cAMP-binding protein